MKMVLGAAGGFFLLLFALIVAVSSGIGTTAVGATQATTAAYSSSEVSNDPSADPFPWGECTYYVWLHAHVTWGGDAKDWLANAEAQGYTTTSYPLAGAIVVYQPAGPYDHQRGHVALVESVSATSYTISEMNNAALGGLGIVDQQTKGWPDRYVEGFIET